ILSALIIRKITGDEKVNDYFIMELPEYRIPSVKRAAQSMLNQAKAFIVKASTIILLCNAAIQVMSTFTWQLEVVSQGNEASSILASVAAPFALILIPLGFGVWQLAAAAITGFIAKENVVGTLAVVFSITNFINVDELALVGGAGNVAGVMGLTSASALAYLAFNLFTPPCFAAIGAMNAELGSKKWLFGAIAFQLAMGYVVAFVIYQAGTLLQTGSTGQGFLWGLVAVGAIVATIAYLMFKRPNEPIRSKFQQG
ncbi:MAG: nucleoside recognition domain-containing protein, partial [Erysipelotrichaceae bacterium]|nr:nucleoside recognition domain-containing protein [Erysipelotrichaceae bacterium]